MKFDRSHLKSSASVVLASIILLSGMTMTVMGQTEAGSGSQEAKSIQAPSGAPVLSTGIVREEDSYRIGPGDLIDVRVFGRPELGRESRVTNQGRIRLPFLNEIQVACLTEAQIAHVVTEKFKKYLRDPQVDIFVKEYKSQPVAVIGSVAQPGRFQLQRRIRLLELLTYAGGPNLNAGGVFHIIRGTAPDFCETADAVGQKQEPLAASVVKVDSTNQTGQNVLSQLSATPNDKYPSEISFDQGQASLLSLKLKEVVLGTPEANPYVRPGDIISIPETDQIFVIGNVVKPGPIFMRSKITLLQAIGMAGGFMPDASKGKVRVVRQEPGTSIRNEIVYDVNEIQRKKAEDIVLMPNDVIDVPTSVPKNTLRSLLSVGVGMVGTVPLWIVR